MILIFNGSAFLLVRFFVCARHGALTCGNDEKRSGRQAEQGYPTRQPLSPLLSNIVLDELDKELESQGLKFVRDDLNALLKGWINYFYFTLLDIKYRLVWRKMKSFGDAHRRKSITQ